MNTLKNIVEYALKQVIEQLSYQGAAILDSVVVGYEEKPDPTDLCHAVIDFKKPVTTTRIHNRRNIVLVDGEGEVIFLFKQDHPLAEDMNDYTPALFFQALLDNPKLDGAIQGDLNPAMWEGGLFELENREGRFYMSTVPFKLIKCPWIGPTE